MEKREFRRLENGYEGKEHCHHLFPLKLWQRENLNFLEKLQVSWVGFDHSVWWNI